MPQMGPMMWMIFPLVMLFMLMLSMGTLESEIKVIVKNNEDNKDFESKMKW